MVDKMQRTVRMDHLRQVGTNHLPAPDDHGSVSLCPTPSPLLHILSLFVILQPPAHFCGLPPLPTFHGPVSLLFSLSFVPLLPPFFLVLPLFPCVCGHSLALPQSMVFLLSAPICGSPFLPLPFPNTRFSLCSLLSVALPLSHPHPWS
jgi:hypothetical protein